MRQHEHVNAESGEPMSNRSTNGYALTPKFWLWLAQEAEKNEDQQLKHECLEKALQAAVREAKQ